MADISNFDGISGTARTAAQLLALIEKIDLAIYNLVSSDKNAGVSYRVGDRTYDREGYLRWLLDARQTYQQQLASLPAWEETVYDDPDL
jgi:hypothetical protein